jgi:hypothetical protein
MTHLASTLALAVSAILVPCTVLAQVSPGADAPNFTTQDHHGTEISLAHFKGKHVVLEWSSPACACVGRHYDGYLQAVQNEMKEKDVVWLVINSTAKGRAGYMGKEEVTRWLRQRKSTPTAYIRDIDGAIGKAYGAKSTPHMFVINPEGKVIYAGALDDNPQGDPALFKTAKNYVRLAMNDAAAGKPVSIPATAPYGCAVKYHDPKVVEAVGIQPD